MKTLLPEIDSADKRFHNGNPATGEQGTRVTDTWLNDVQDRVRDVQAEAHYVLQKAGFKPISNKTTQLYDAIIKIISDNRNTASTTKSGEVQLSSAIDSDEENKAATPKAVKTAYDKAVEAKEAAEEKQSPATTLSGYGISNFKVEGFVGDVNTLKTDGLYAVAQASRSQNLPVPGNGCHIQVIGGGDSTWCRQIAYITYSGDMYERHQMSYLRDEWSPWKKLNTDGLPVGAIVSFPREVTNPAGFLRANGTTFNAQTFPDLHRTLGSNKLPNLTRSDVGMTAYFAVDSIPDGWIAFDDIARLVTQQSYPELHRYLVGKYGSIANVPKAEDRFIRNAGNGLSVGQKQDDEIKAHTHYKRTYNNPSSVKEYFKIYGSAYEFNSDATNLNNPFVDTWGDNTLHDNGWVKPSIDSKYATGGTETRPKSLVLKLCIKAINAFDDVVFWIKSHGEVTNAGALDAGRLAQGLQDKADRNHTHTTSQIEDFNQGVTKIIEQGFAYQKIGDFEIRKYPDGTMIQTLTHNFTANNDSRIVAKLIFPIAFAKGNIVFSAMPTSIANRDISNDNFDFYNSNCTLFKQGNTGFHICVYDVDNHNANFSVDITAIGRWK